MSLFDIIKYSNNDLNSENELEKLPSGLLDLYWLKTTKKAEPPLAYNKVWMLTLFYKNNPKKQTKYFKEALEEYDEPI